MLAETQPETYRVSGRAVRREMRRHGVTIRVLAARMDVTQAAVRKARLLGLEGPAAFDYLQGIYGEWTPRLRAAFRQWRRQRGDLL